MKKQTDYLFLDIACVTALYTLCVYLAASFVAGSFDLIHNLDKGERLMVGGVWVVSLIQVIAIVQRWDKEDKDEQL